MEKSIERGIFWPVVPGFVPSPEVIQEIGRRFYAARKNYICEGWPNPDDLLEGAETLEYCADLYAAAPDLYKVLKNLLEAIEEHDKQPPYSYLSDATGVVQAKSALAKARGKT